MGNSESNTAQKKNTNSPRKPALKKPRVPGPVNAYNYPQPYLPQYPYPYPYAPGPYFDPRYPVPSNESYINSKYYPQPKGKTKVNEQPNPKKYHNAEPVYHSHDSYYNHNGQLTPYGHNHPPHNHQHRHRHHHHRHQSTSPIEKEQPNPPTLQNRVYTPRPPPPPPPPTIQALKPVSTILTTKVISPAPQTEIKLPPLPPPPSLPPPASNSSPIVAQIPIFPIIETKYPPLPSALSKNIPLPISLPSDSFEKAPPIETNYVPKSPSIHSIHQYGSDTISIARRSPQRHVPSANRWYDHTYDKGIKSLTILDNN